jgi:hypothetical protein
MLVVVATDIGLASVLIVEVVGAVAARTRKTGTSIHEKKYINKIFRLIFILLGFTDVIR